jgi:hypothetical protein
VRKYVIKALQMLARYQGHSWDASKIHSAGRGAQEGGRDVLG